MHIAIAKIRALVVICVVGSVVGLSGCASAPPVQTNTGIEGTISNHTKRSIVRVAYQECGQKPENWMPVSVAALAVNQRAAFRVSTTCADFDAFFDDGKLAGSQRGVQNKYPLEWVIE